MNESLRALRDALRAAWREAIAEMDPRPLVSRHLPPRPPRGARVRVLAAGKAALGMAEGAIDRWGDAVGDVLVVTVEGVAPGDADPRVLVRAAGHPIPDERSVAAAEDALTRAASLGPRDLCLALVSGGASSLLCAPADGLALERKRAVVERLLAVGAPIAEVNLVRRHLSRIKGGRLAGAAHPARVLTLITSDVIGGHPADVGSGPTVPCLPDPRGARAVLARWAPELAESMSVLLRSDPLPPVRARSKVIAAPEDLARALARRLAERGWAVRVGASDAFDDTKTVERRLEAARRLGRGEAEVIACEPTVALPSARGRGGRCGRCALLAVGRLPEGVALMCAASDGVDGSSGTSGALVTSDDVRDAVVERALEAFDDAAGHAALGTSLAGGPTGVNLADVHVVARAF